MVRGLGTTYWVKTLCCVSKRSGSWGLKYLTTAATPAGLRTQWGSHNPEGGGDYWAWGGGGGLDGVPMSHV